MDGKQFEVIRKGQDGFLFRSVWSNHSCGHSLPREFTRLFGFETPMGDTMVKGGMRACAASDWLTDEGWTNTTSEALLCLEK